MPVRNKTQYPDAYKDKSRLTYYSSLFSSIEINSSFYKLPLSKTIAKWAAEVEGAFNFTFKLWQNITHNKNLVFDPADIQRFMAAIDNVDEKKGCLLIQFPGSIKSENIYQLDYLLSEVANHNTGWKVAVEFRDSSWYNDDSYGVLEKYKAAMVIHDMGKCPAPVENKSNADFIYLRFHGPGGRYSGSYEDDFLYDYANLIVEWLDDDKAVYCYFNNTMGDAVKNLMTLNSMVKDLR
ncbi:DUF72 domain-containing protein [Mucilaginibacter ginkgonis]|uniref:DUF72 domain-containing protein n=1 Tax=Mucilaginibacter ginkgonis TaxID=2682091 RepID=UPI0037443C5C